MICVDLLATIGQERNEQRFLCSEGKKEKGMSKYVKINEWFRLDKELMYLKPLQFLQGVLPQRDLIFKLISKFPREHVTVVKRCKVIITSVLPKQEAKQHLVHVVGRKEGLSKYTCIGIVRLRFRPF